MRITRIDTRTNAFNGNFAEKSAKFLADQGTHLIVQGIGLYVSHKIQPITNFETFMQHKFFVDAGEFIGSKIMNKAITAKKQFSNFFSFLADNKNIIIGWIDKFQKLVNING